MELLEPALLLQLHKILPELERDTRLQVSVLPQVDSEVKVFNLALHYVLQKQAREVDDFIAVLVVYASRVLNQ